MPDVILTTGSAGLIPLLQVTRTIPIVFTVVPDPVGAGFVDSLARPGGNATGFVQFEFGLTSKWLELLKEIAPGITRVAVLREPGLTAAIAQFAAIQAVALFHRVELVPLNFRNQADIEQTVATFAPSSGDGMIATSGPLAAVHRKAIIATAARHKLPTVCLAIYRPGWWTDFLWARFPRPILACGSLRPSHPAGREAGRPAGAGADQV